MANFRQPTKGPLKTHKKSIKHFLGLNFMSRDKGLILVNKNLNPFTPAIISNDNHVQDLVQTLKNEGFLNFLVLRKFLTNAATYTKNLAKQVSFKKNYRLKN